MFIISMVEVVARFERVLVLRPWSRNVRQRFQGFRARMRARTVRILEHSPHTWQLSWENAVTTPAAMHARGPTPIPTGSHA